MARLIEPTPEEEAEHRAWVAERPAHVRAVAERFDPWSLYRLKSTGHRVVLRSFGEGEGDSVTLRVAILAEFNAVAFEREVFGIDPADLEPCEAPGPDEPVGAVLTEPEDIDAFVDAVRPAVLAARRAH